MIGLSALAFRIDRDYVEKEWMMSEARHLTTEELHTGSTRSAVRRATTALVLIVRRPGIDEREVLEHGDLDTVQGLVGDSWNRRGSSRSIDGGPHPDMQLNIMNARAIALVAQSQDRWPLAGDQLFVDLDLSPANLPPGTRLAIGSAIVEVTAEPHTGCGKFVSRFGVEAMKFVNSTIGRELSLRGINAKVVQPGAIRIGDAVRKMPAH
jgi:MOSC domain-containing protein YiiM